MKTRPFAFAVSLGVTMAAPAGAGENDPPNHEEVLAPGRVELRPFAGWEFAPNSATGAFVGADVAFRWSRFFALGGGAAWYAPFDRAASAGSSYPRDESRWSADLDALVTPWPARAHAGTTATFEPYVLAGLGILATRPIAIIDPSDRHFDDNTHLDLSLGAGVRLFLAEQIAILVELRDVLYFEKIENRQVAPNLAADPATWYAPNSVLTNAIQARLGLSFFVLGG